MNNTCIALEKKKKSSVDFAGHIFFPCSSLEKSAALFYSFRTLLEKASAGDSENMALL
jgi:hypothetical protein